MRILSAVNKYTLWIVLVLSMLSSSAYAANPPTAYDMMKPPTFASVELSPNGRYIAFIRVKTDKYCINRYGSMTIGNKSRCKDKKKSYRTTHTIRVYDLDQSKVIQDLKLPENFYAYWLEWANNDRLLASLHRPTTIGERGQGYTLGGARIVSLPIKGGDYVALFDNQKGVGNQNRNLTSITNFLRNDPQHIIMPANRNGDLDLWKVNVVTGQAERIEQGKDRTFYWYTDRAGKPLLRFDCVGRSCRKIKVYAPKTDEDGWKLIKTFRSKPDEDENDFDFWPIAAAPEDGQFYVLSKEDEAERRSIKLYDTKTEKYLKTVFEHPTVDVGGAVLDLQTGDYAGAWFYEDRLNYSFENPSLQKHYNGLGTFFGNKENVDLLGFNADGSKAVVYVSAPDNPGEYHVYDLKTRHVERLLGRYGELNERLDSQTDILQIPTRDGKTITAYHAYPKGEKLKKAPLLVMPHGGPEQRDYFDYDSVVQYFVTHGYQVLQVNFRGSSGYGRKFAEAGYGEWGGVMQNDLIDAVKYLYAQNLASADNACIVGYSYGGYAALFAGATTPELFKCVVSGGGLSDILADIKHTKKVYGSDSESYEYWLKSMGDPKTDKGKLKSVSPVYMAEQFKAPVLLVHGEYDSNVDISQSRKMRKALNKAGKTVEFLKLEDVGHSNWGVENEVLYLETVEAFVSKYLTK